MNLAENLPKLAVLAVIAAGVALAGSKFFSSGDEGRGELVLPAFSQTAQAGQAKFTENCVQCHGVNALGTDKGPPFVHPIYNPGHHSDLAFLRAIEQGVRQHHWSFGDMPPQPQVSEQDLLEIIAYVRELQVANGIVYQEHKM